MDAEDLAPRDAVWVEPDPIEPARLEALVSDPAAGAVVVFIGTVRDHSEGRDGVTHLEYEAYAGVVEDKISEVIDDVRDRWPEVLRVAAVHRIGSLEVGEAAVCVAVSSPHRPAAFEAAAHLIDQLKQRAPIWKKEHWPGGAEWVREGTGEGTP